MNRLTFLALWLLCIPTAIVGLLWALFAGLSNPRGRRAWSILRGFDQTGNAMLGGHEDDTVSFTIAVKALEGKPWAVAACRIMDLFDRGHCAQSLKGDR